MEIEYYEEFFFSFKYSIAFCWKPKKISKLFKNTLYTCKQPLMMANERSESTQDNFGKFIH